MKDLLAIIALDRRHLPGGRPVGRVALHLVRRRSLRYQLMIATLLPVLAVVATVLVNVRLMFLSGHDSMVDLDRPW